MANAVPSEALDQLFRSARTYNEWRETDVDERTLRDLYDLLKWRPTSANVCPARAGQFAGWELTGAAGLSEDESHGQAPHP